MAAGLALAAGTGCRGAGRYVAVPNGEALPSLVTPAELAKRQDEMPVLLLDTRGKAAYDAGHIPGALSAPLEELKPFPEDNLEEPFRARVERLAEAYGIRTEYEIVTADAGSGEGFQRAATACWAVNLVGGYRCRVLQGGVTAWQAAQGKLITTPGKPPENIGPDKKPLPPSKIPLRPVAFASLDILRQATAVGELALIDVSPAEGEPQLLGAQRLPLRSVLKPDGSVDVEKLLRLASESGIRPETEALVVGESLLDGATGWFLVHGPLGIPVAGLYPGGLKRWRTFPPPPADLGAPPPVPPEEKSPSAQKGKTPGKKEKAVGKKPARKKSPPPH